MKRNSKLRKVIMGGVGFAMAVIVFFVGSMQSMQEVEADIRVFDKITEKFPYEENKAFKLSILEIVPDKADEVKEIGYFLENLREQESPLNVSHGTVHGTVKADLSGIEKPEEPKLTQPTWPSGYWDPVNNVYVQPTQEQMDEYYAASAAYNQEQQDYKNKMDAYNQAVADATAAAADAAYADTLYQLRTYGMIRPTGPDSNGSYPIYAEFNNAGVAIFSNYQNPGCNNAYPQSYTLGVYEMAAGDYNIADGFAINDEGYICKVNQVSSNTTVSAGGLVSGNETTIELVPVMDIISSKLSLPTSEEYGQLITAVAEADLGNGVGNVKFTRSETITDKKQYYGLSDQQLYYRKESNTDFYNSNYFKEYVLGSRTKYENKPIIYNTVKASEVTKEEIANADLVYISGKSVDFAIKNTDGSGNDISEEILLELYNQEVKNHKAILMDYACYSADAKTNISKLAVLLWRENQNAIKTTYESAYGDESDPDIMTNLDFLKGDALKELKESMMTGANGNFVTGNVYVYNHHLSDFDDPKSMIDAGDIFANGDFNSAYTASVMQAGFTNVLSYITTTNKNSTTGLMIPSVTPAVAVQYILISDGNPLTVVKSSLNVLEIQPVMSFLYNEGRGSEEYQFMNDKSDAKKNRETFVESYLGEYYKDKVEFVEFTSMTVDEFNGRNEDLVETYDIIYIGSERGDLYYTEELNTVKKENGKYGTGTEKQQLPSYTDKKMSGNVYYSIGDALTMDGGITTNVYAFLDKPTYDARYAGRDITADKLGKLKEYLESESLIFVAGDLMATTSAGISEINPTAIAEPGDKDDHGRVDNSSNMYELLRYAQGYRFNYTTGAYENASDEGSYDTYSNLISIDDVLNKVVEKSTVDQYVSTEKLEIMMSEQPREYTYSTLPNSQVIDADSIQYLEEEADGTRELKYEFMITSAVDNAFTTVTYTPSLYIDVNNDGKYSAASENVKDIKIVVQASGAEAEKDAQNNYVLNKDVVYEMTRALDESYSGYLKWKLNIQANGYANSHASVEGSTVVKNVGEEDVIQILQLTDNDGSNLNLQTQAESETSLFGKYLAAVPGYRVVIKTMTVKQFEDDFKAKWDAYNGDMTIQEFALQYFKEIEIVAPTTTDANDGSYGADMLVLGFGDDFAPCNTAEAISAIQSYMESENPVLLTHDFIMFRAPSNQVKYLRNSVGMDKYGVTQNIVKKKVGNDTVAELANYMIDSTGEKILHSGDTYTRTDKEDNEKIQLIESVGKAVAYQPGTERGMVLKYTQGLSNGTLVRFKKTGNNWLNVNGLGGGNDNGATVYTVDKLNSGQITSYPYNLPDSFKVTHTHGQYYQLDLDADDDNDGESDVVVWYTLGESSRENYNPWGAKAAGPSPSDGYYIYNKGNITYTGAGHSDMTKATETEAQLFINTLFAAYNAATTHPAVRFYEEAPDALATPISSVAIPYDKNVTKDNAIDSSILKDAQGEYRYHFVNPNVTVTDLGTPMFFRLADTNFVRGTKYMEIEYYMKVDGKVGAEFELDDKSKATIELLKYRDAEIPVVNISEKMTTYKVHNGVFTDAIALDVETGKLSTLESEVPYGFYLPLSYLNDNSQVTIYITAKTRIYTISSQTNLPIISEVEGMGVGELTVTKTDLLDLD